jgi:hypothetical protein
MKRRMMQHRWVGIGAAAGLALVSLSTVTVLGGAATAAAQTPVPLVGNFEIAPGTYTAGSGAGGSYFRMLVPGGTLNGSDSNYVANTSSTASDQTYTLLSPGNQGGLVAGTYQPAPDPAFDGSGNALADLIIAPVPFEGTNFSVETQTPDAQTGTDVPTPSISDSSGNLTGSLQALSASWNSQYFNQGSPKPDGSSPGLTAGPTGTYDSATGAYSFTWTSEIVGGAFNGFTGQWVLAGTFDPFYIKTTSLPDVTPGASYGPVTLKATGGTKPYTWKVRTGTLPKGLTLSTSGVLSGKAGKKLAAGTDTFTVQAKTHATKTSPSETATETFDLTISAPASIART